MKRTIIATKSLTKFRKSVYCGKNKIRKPLRACPYIPETMELDKNYSMQ